MTKSFQINRCIAGRSLKDPDGFGFKETVDAFKDVLKTTFLNSDLQAFAKMCGKDLSENLVTTSRDVHTSEVLYEEGRICRETILTERFNSFSKAFSRPTIDFMGAYNVAVNSISDMQPIGSQSLYATQVQSHYFQEEDGQITRRIAVYQSFNTEESVTADKENKEVLQSLLGPDVVI